MARDVAAETFDPPRLAREVGGRLALEAVSRFLRRASRSARVSGHRPLSPGHRRLLAALATAGVLLSFGGQSCSAGASPALRSLWGAWPQARPLVASYGVLRWEFNPASRRWWASSEAEGWAGLVMLSDGLSDAVRRTWLAPAVPRSEPGAGAGAPLAVEAGGAVA